MHKLARFADARNTAEGKFVAILLSVLLVFSFLNVTMFTDRANAKEEDPEVILPIEDVEAEEEEESTDPTDEVVVENDEVDEATTIDEGGEPEGEVEDIEEMTDPEPELAAPVEGSDELEKFNQSAPLTEEIGKATASLPLVSRTAPSQQPVYCYGLMPGGDPNDKDVNANWYGLAKVFAYTEPSTDYESGTARVVPIEAPVDLPDLTYSGKVYKYAPPGSGNESKENYYTVEWKSYITVSSGVSAGSNGIFTVVDGNKTANNSYHWDATISVNQIDHYTVQFRVQQPGSNEFAGVSDNFYYSKEKGTPFSSLKVPQSTDVPIYKEVDGKGYLFEGWYLDTACTEKVSFDSDSTLQQNTVFYGRYVAEQHTVTYKSDDKVVATEKQNCKETFDVAAALEKDGYTFTGWIGDDGQTYAPREQVTMPHADLTLTAQWEPNQVLSYEVRYLEEGAANNEIAERLLMEAPNGKPWKVGQKISDFANTQIDIPGYTFVKVEPNPLVLAPSDNVVTAYYKKRTDVSYTVRYLNKDDNTELINSKVVEDQTYKAEVTESAVDVPGYSPVEASQTVTLEASGNVITFYYTAKDGIPYKVNHYKETLDGDKYELCETENLTGKTGVEVTATPKGYEGFTCVETIPNTVASGVIKGDGSLELSLYYKRNTYTVSYAWEHAPGAAGTPPKSMEYKFGQPVTVVEKPEVAGYTFEGWTPSPSVIIDADKDQFTMPAENVVLTGNWVPKTDTRYIITYYFQNADGVYPSSATEATSVDEEGVTDTVVTVKPDDLKIPVGYEYDDDADNKLTGTITADNPLTLKVYYKRASFPITYEYEGPIPEGAPAVPSAGSKRFGELVDRAAALELPGYTFDGWQTDDVEVSESGEFEMPTKPVTFTGKWTPRSDTKYVVQYYYEEQGVYPETPTMTSDPRSGTTDADASIIIGSDDVPLKGEQGRTYVYDAGNPQAVTTAKVKGDGTTVLKVYFKQQINITFQPGDHGTFKETTRKYFYGGEVAAPEPTGEDGYTFVGWAPETNVADPAKATVDNTYVAQWEANTDTRYTVKYFYMSAGKYFDDANYSETRLGTTGSQVELTEADKATGEEDYVYDAAATEDAKAMSGTVAGDGSTVLKVYFKQNFTVKFTTDGSKEFFADEAVTEHPNLEYGALAPYTPTIDPQKVYGWKLTGWKDVATGEVTPVESALPEVTKSVTYEAQWAADEKTTYQVTYKATKGGRLANVEDGAELINTLPVVQNASVTGAIADDPDEGFKFDGWYKADGGEAEFLTANKQLDAVDAQKHLNRDLDKSIWLDTTYLAKFVPDWTGLHAQGINETYDGAKKNLVVSGLVADDVVTVGDDTIRVRESGSFPVASYENVTDEEVIVKVKRGSFEITLDPVKVVIKPAELTIKKDLTQTFTGFAHVLDLTSEDVKGVVGNQVVDLDVYNADKFARTVEGTSQWNALKDDALKIKKKTGEETTSNYNITVDLKLTVTPLTIEPSGEGEEPKLTVTDPIDAVYDFAEHKFAPVVVNVVTAPRTELIAGEDYGVSYYRLNDEGERVATTDFVNVGTIVTVIEGKGNYTGTVEKTYEITPLPVVVTANDTSKVYGQADPALTVAVADKAGAAKPNDGFDIQYAIEREAGEAVGSYVITPSGAAEQGNYRVTYAPGTFRIAASDENTVTVANLVGTTGLAKVYDGEPTWVTPTASVAGSTFEYSLDGRTWTAEAPSFTNAGSYAVWVRANAANYETTPAVRATVTINPRPITITVNNASKVRGEADPVFTGSITAGTLVNANDLGAITFSRTNRTNRVGMYPGVLTANFVDNDNYTVTVELGNFTVRPAATPAPADDDDDPTTPGRTNPTPGTTVTPEDTTPTTVIDNDDAPLAGEPTDTDFDATVDDAGVEEAIGDDATPMAARGNIQDEDVPLGAFEDDHAACWVHWIMLLGLVATAVYGIAVVRRRLGMTGDIDDFEDQIMGRNTVTETQPSTADGRQAL